MNLTEQRLRQALDGFLDAFRNLDLVRFIAFFSTGATVFFPFESASRRAEGIEEIKTIFTTFFTYLSERQPAVPPYLQLDPTELQITLTGKMALVSFHLHDSFEGQITLCRRSMVWLDEGRRWRIIHLHASNLAQRSTGSTGAPEKRSL